MSHQDERAIRTILVCGDDIIATSAALAFAIALPEVRVSLLVSQRSTPSIHDFALATLPEIGRFHAAVGIDEGELLHRGAAVHHIGTRFCSWPAGGGAWVHAYGDYGMPDWPVFFHHLWARAAPERRLPYHSYSAAGVLAEAGKFVHPQASQWPLSTYRYGLRLDPKPYAAVIRDHAERAGVAFVNGGWGDVELGGSGVAAVRTRDGQRLEADLFVDSTGADALLIGALGEGLGGWSDLFPFSRLSLKEVEGATLPADRIEGSSNGWRWSQPLPGRTAVTVAGTDEGASFAYGHRARPWVGNVVAIGEAAGTVDPLYGINLQLAHAAILRALELLPGRDFDRVEVAEYNRRTELVMIRARDFLALHYLRPDRPVPDSLGHTIDQFGERGRLPFYADESFTRDSWVAALLGMGIVPKRGDAVAGRIDENTSLDAMDRLAASLENLPARLPPYSEYLRQLLPAAMR